MVTVQFSLAQKAAATYSSPSIPGLRKHQTKADRKNMTQITDPAAGRELPLLSFDFPEPEPKGRGSWTLFFPSAPHRRVC